MSTIPVSELVAVNPSVIAAGGASLSSTGLLLTSSTRPPINGTNLPTVLSFPNAAAVATYFGAASHEAQIAGGGLGLGTGYFGGFTGAGKLPAAILVAQYNQVAVSAYLRGGNAGSALTLAQLQALSGSLTVVMDGYSHVISSISLASYNSFSAAATGIQSAFTDPTEASFTASMGGHFSGCTSSGTTLTLGAVVDGYLSAGDLVSGTDTTNSLPAGCFIVKQLTGTAGGAAGATFQLSAAATPGNLTSCTVTGTSKNIDVTAVASGSLAVGQTVVGTTVPSGTLITAQITGTAGAAGVYSTSAAAQGIASESMTGAATAPTVTFDSTSGAFVVTSGITGAPSTAAFATGTLAAPLLLTQATGAVLSQGAAPATPATFMNALITQNSNWVSFMTGFDPDGGSGNAVKQAFAAWKNTQNNRFIYVCWDTDVTPTNTLPATSSLGYILANNGDSGTCLIYEATDLNLAAFVMGSIASVDFSANGGRVDFSYKSQPGLVASVSDPTVAANLAGNPQQANSFGNGYNFYGAYGSATTNFVWFQRETVTGPYQWLDSYLNQIVMNYSLQNAGLTYLGSVKSAPYAPAGYNGIEAALTPTIQQFLAFGAFGPDTLSASEISAVNNQASVNAGKTVDAATPIQTQGYFLQIVPAPASVRQNRTSPQITFFYLDQGSIHALDLSSIALQ